jgi:hypothetical protein
MIFASGRLTSFSSTVLATDVRARPARRPLFGRRRRPKALTSTGWFLVLCVAAVAVGSALAIAL